MQNQTTVDMAEPDSLLEALQSQVTFYKGELDNVKGEIKSLIRDNTDMSKQLEILVKKNQEMDNIILQHENDKDEITELQNQLLLLQKEKQSFNSLWQTSQSTIKSLENELSTYEKFHRASGVSSENIVEAKNEYSAIIKMLETKLANGLQLIKSKEEEIESVTKERDKAVRKCDNKEIILHENLIKLNEQNDRIKTLEIEISSLKNELSTSKHYSDELLVNMDLCKKNMNLYVKKELESRIKVEEALSLVDGAILERDTALEKEKSAIEESTRLSKQVTEILNQSTIRVKKEVDMAKQCYNDKLNDMLIHIQRLELELGENKLELETLHREYLLLEEKSKKTKTNKSQLTEEKDGKILLLEQKFEATFQQLLLSERRNIQIVSEKENLQMDFDQLVNNFHRDKRKREWENKLHSNEINSLKKQISNLKESLNEAHQSIQKLQSDLIFKEDLEENLTNDKFIITKEFEKHFHNQQKLNTKWRDSVKQIIIKLEMQVEKLMKDIEQLKEENSRLKTQLM